MAKWEEKVAHFLVNVAFKRNTERAADRLTGCWRGLRTITHNIRVVIREKMSPYRRYCAGNSVPPRGRVGMCNRESSAPECSSCPFSHARSRALQGTCPLCPSSCVTSCQRTVNSQAEHSVKTAWSKPSPMVSHAVGICLTTSLSLLFAILKIKVYLKKMHL